jgi:uncharacterized protein involved in exopolysaccharide biosynthesis
MNPDYNKSEEGVIAGMKEISIMDIFSDFWRIFTTRFKWFVIAGVIVGAVSTFFALKMENMYTAKATVLPSQSNNSSLSSILGGVSGLSGLIGGGFGTESLELYPAIAGSDTVLAASVEHEHQGLPLHKHLYDFFELDVENSDTEKRWVINKLRKKLVARTNPKQQTFNVSFESNDPELSAHVVNSVVMEMDNYLRYKMRTEARQQLDLIEDRLVVVRDSLKQGERNLIDFREKNRVITSSPNLMMDEMRLLRQVEMHSTVFVELTKQHEVVKIQELGQLPVLNILDWAKPPLKKSGPSRSVFVLGYLFFAEFLLLMFFKVQELGWFKKLNPARAKKRSHA